MTSQMLLFLLVVISFTSYSEPGSSDEQSNLCCRASRPLQLQWLVLRARTHHQPTLQYAVWIDDKYVFSFRVIKRQAFLRSHLRRIRDAWSGHWRQKWQETLVPEKRRKGRRKRRDRSSNTLQGTYYSVPWRVMIDIDKSKGSLSKDYVYYVLKGEVHDGGLSTCVRSWISEEEKIPDLTS